MDFTSSLPSTISDVVNVKPPAALLNTSEELKNWLIEKVRGWILILLKSFRLEQSMVEKEKKYESSIIKQTTNYTEWL